MSYNREGSYPLIPGFTPSSGLRDCDTQKIPLIPPLAHGIQGKAHVISNLLRALTAYMQVRYGSGERPEDQGYCHAGTHTPTHTRTHTNLKPYQPPTQGVTEETPAGGEDRGPTP